MTTAPLNSLPPVTPTPSATILVADDDSLMQILLRQFLEKEGHQVVIAQNGREALKSFAEVRPEIVLLDGIMPEINGFDCCQELMATETPPLVLIITVLEDEVSVDRAFAAGAIDYVTKPIHWPVLRQRVRRLLEQSRLQRELEEANKLLRKLARIDPLTKLANREWLEKFLDREWPAAIREQVPMTIVICDVDYFKYYNDYYGHPGGDECLKAITQALKAIVHRPKDLVVRYGGEEFLLVLPNTGFAGAQVICKRLQQEVRARQIPHAKSLVAEHVTMSMGSVTLIPKRGETWQPAISQADKCLYQAKAKGRNHYININLIVPESHSVDTVTGSAVTGKV